MKCQTNFNVMLMSLIVAISCAKESWRGEITVDGCPSVYKLFTEHTACLAKAADSVVDELSAKDKQEIVDLHNNYRRKVTPKASNMLKMKWDDEVAMIAQKWLSSCENGLWANNRLNHDKNHQRFIPARFTVGQNLGMGFSHFKGVIKAWFDEYKDYKYGVGATSPDKMVGHYTQMVWAKSYIVGCAKGTCGPDKVKLQVCNYGPAGNMIGEKPYEVKEPTCKKNDDGLCDCTNTECINTSPLDVTTCTCTCTAKYFLGSDCKLDCTLDDKFFCGTGTYFTKKACTGTKAQHVSMACPKMCGICDKKEGDGDQDDNKDDNEDDNKDDNEDDNKDDNEDGHKHDNDSASQLTVQVSLTIGILHSLYQYINRRFT